MKAYLVEVHGFERVDDRAAEYATQREAVRVARNTWHHRRANVRRVLVLDPSGKTVWGASVASRFKEE